MNNICAMRQKPLRGHCAKSVRIAVGPVNVNDAIARNLSDCARNAHRCGRLHFLTGPWGALKGSK